MYLSGSLCHARDYRSQRDIRLSAYAMKRQRKRTKDNVIFFVTVGDEPG
jgi:hypothetical protein